MSIHRRFNPWGHYQVGDAAAVAPVDDGSSSASAAAARRAKDGSGFGTGFLVGFAISGLLCMAVVDHTSR